MNAGWIGFPKETDADFWASATAYAALGYKGFEGGEALLTTGDTAANMQRLQDLGLTVLTVSASVDEVRDNPQAVIARAKAVGAPRASIWASGQIWGDPPSKDAMFEEIDALDKAAAIFAKEGIKLCYHNHDKEFFIMYDGVRLIDHMMQRTQFLWLEADVAWITAGGEKPVRFLKQYAKRLAAVHIKDYIPTIVEEGNRAVTKPIFTSLGTGVVNLPKVLNYLHKINFDWVVYEQDELRNLSSLESMTQSYLYMKELGVLS